MIDSRISKEGNSVRRRRECMKCTYRFTTLEEIVPTEITVIKHDRRREEFAPGKIKEGIRKACWKRPITEEQLDETFYHVHLGVENLGMRDIPSEKIGEIIMDELKKLDQVAYVRFASIYRQFKDVDQFIHEISILKDDKK